MSADGWDMILNSLQLYAWNLLFVTPTALLFSYYISKQYKFSGFFRVVLYLPTIVSSLIMALLYKYIVTDVYGFLTGDKVGLLGGTDTDRIYYTVLFFNIWIAYGSNVMLYTGAMSNIDTSILEAAKLDGANTIQEFGYIYLPLIFPTIITFILTGIAGIFTNQMAMFHIFGSNVPSFDVFGYFFYRQTAGNPTLFPSAKKMSLPELSALGLIITAIIAPITLLVRKGLEKIGPSSD
ncbi:MAG: sugar ABC transporter permease [Clostridia bacterium]|nr:sugar ABC transporter permease [Clostridia bacterium]